MVGDFYWHGPTKFNISNKIVSIFCEDVDRIPEKKVWYLRGLRQHIGRRYQKINGFKQNGFSRGFQLGIFKDISLRQNISLLYLEQSFLKLRKYKISNEISKLLIFEPGEGCEPLCQFLGCSQPSTDYPNVNSTEEFSSRMKSS